MEVYEENFGKLYGVLKKHLKGLEEETAKEEFIVNEEELEVKSDSKLELENQKLSYLIEMMKGKLEKSRENLNVLEGCYSSIFEKLEALCDPHLYGDLAAKQPEEYIEIPRPSMRNFVDLVNAFASAVGDFPKYKEQIESIRTLDGNTFEKMEAVVNIMKVVLDDRKLKLSEVENLHQFNK